MYIDLACHDIETTKQDVQKATFVAIENDLNGISILPYFISFAKEFIYNGMTFSCPIDYPDGLNETKIRNHEVLSAIRHGVNTVDLVIQKHHIINSEFKKISDDILSNKKICEDNNTTLRVMLEYRIFSKENLNKCIIILKETGITTMFPSTGHMLDNLVDNLVIGVNTQNDFGIDAIVNGNLWRPDQFQMIQKSEVFGVRLSTNVFLQIKKEHLLGV